MNPLTDQQLLQDYAGCRSESAFAELVKRHVDFVHSAALRMVRDAHLAEDVTQSVFLALAGNAGQLAGCAVLSAWLHRTTRNLAANAVRSDVRRRAREQEAVTMNDLLSSESDGVWESIAPHLDAALGELNAPDRDALLLRYFERKSAHEMAHTLGTSEEAAQKRVSRAVERLREMFAKRGVTVSTGGLIFLISAHAVQGAPIGLALTVSTVSTIAGTAVQTSTAIAATKAIAMTTMQKALVGAAFTVIAGTGIYEFREATRLRTEIQRLERLQAEQVQQSEREQAEASARLAVLRDETERSRRDAAELARLRGEVAGLRARQQQTGNLQRATPQRDNTGPTNREPAENQLPKESWADAGFATPQAALRTRGWSVLNGNRERFKDSMFITDGARKTLEEMLIQMAEASKDPNKARFLQEILKNQFGVEEGILMPMMAEHRQKGYLGYRILSEQSPSADERILELETALVSAPAKKETLKFQRFGTDWKVVIDEDFVTRVR